MDTPYCPACGQSPARPPSAAGILIFSLVSGFFPLEDARPSDWRFRKLAEDQSNGIGSCDSIYAMYKLACPFSVPLREMLHSMLTIDADKRPSLESLAAHAWFNPPNPPPSAYSYEEDDYNEPIVYR